MDTLPTTDDRRAAARAALAGAERNQKHEAEQVVLAGRREEAIRSLEGSARHLEKEKIAKAEQLATLAAEQEAAAKQRAIEDAEKARAQTESARAAAENARRVKITQAEKTIEEVKKVPSNLSPIRTLKSDLTEAATSEKISLTRIALKTEEKNRLTTTETGKKHRTSTILWLLVLLLVAAGGGIYFFGFLQISMPDTTITPITTPMRESLIFAEKHKELDLGAAGPRELKRQIMEEIAAAAGNDEILELVFTLNNRTAALRAWQEKMELGRNENFLSAFDSKLMFGIYGQTPGAFLVLVPTNYDRAFAGMLNWEKTLGTDLAPLFASEAITVPRDLKFTDQILKNVDVRQLDQFLIYGFLNRNLLVIARDTSTLSEVIDRYRNAGQ